MISFQKFRIQTSSNLTFTSVPDPKLIILDPDPQILNYEFRIRIRILDSELPVTIDGEKKVVNFGYYEDKMG